LGEVGHSLTIDHAVLVNPLEQAAAVKALAAQPGHLDYCRVRCVGFPGCQLDLNRPDSLAAGGSRKRTDPATPVNSIRDADRLGAFGAFIREDLPGSP